MEKRVEQKVNEIEGYVEELSTFIPSTFEEYNSDLVKKAACERYLGKIMDVAKSLAIAVVKHKDLPLPESDSAVYMTLAENYIIDEALSQKLLELEQMKQVVHSPDEFVEDSEVYRLLKEELINLNDFIGIIKESG